jgi:hypothetical protein
MVVTVRGIDAQLFQQQAFVRIRRHRSDELSEVAQQ